MKNTANQKGFVIKRLQSGGVITNYFCTSSCGHCLYFCSPKWKKDYIKKEMLVKIIEKIRSLGCTSIHIGGGEPFLDLSGLEMVVETCALWAGVKIALRRSASIGIDYVETNSSWYKGMNSACEILSSLKERGLSALLVSMSPFEKMGTARSYFTMNISHFSKSRE